jgi:glyoxylase-like metal-dependent hydrolase (beta-lactamase superfamily II)
MKARVLLAVLESLALGGLAAWAAGGTQIKDTESASHGANDAFHQLVDTYKFPEFEIVQFNLPVLSHYSYLVVSAGEAVLVDPDRDINAYLDYAKKNNLAIQGVFLTHSHADFVAGHLEARSRCLSIKTPLVARNTRSNRSRTAQRFVSAKPRSRRLQHLATRPMVCAGWSVAKPTPHPAPY